MEVVKPLLLFVLFFTAVIKIIIFNKKINKAISFLLAIVFGLFNGLGFSEGFKSGISSAESVFLPIIEAFLGVFTSVVLLSLGLLIVFTGLKIIFKTSKRKYILIFPVLVVLLSLKMMIKEFLN